jgi:hypothetical protein
MVAVVAPVICWIVWQSVSKVATGAAFALRFLTEDRTAREVWDVLFTSAFLVNALVYVYFALGW